MEHNKWWKIPICWTYLLTTLLIGICKRNQIFSLEGNAIHYRIIRCVFFIFAWLLLLCYLIAIHDDRKEKIEKLPTSEQEKIKEQLDRENRHEYKTFRFIYYLLISIVLATGITFILSIYHEELGYLFYMWSASIWFLVWLRIDDIKNILGKNIPSK